MQIRGEDRKGRLDGVPTDEISPCDAYLTSGLLVVVVLQARGIDESVDKTPSKLENLSPLPFTSLQSPPDSVPLVSKMSSSGDHHAPDDSHLSSSSSNDHTVIPMVRAANSRTNLPQI